MLIKTKSHEQMKVGRLCLDINDMRKMVRIYPINPTEPAPNRAEMVAMQKYLAVVRPDIVHPSNTMTGWALESSFRI